MLVEGVNFHLLLSRDVVEHAEDRARRTGVVPQAIGNHRAAANPRGEVQAVEITKRADRILVKVREAFQKPGE